MLSRWKEHLRIFGRAFSVEIPEILCLGWGPLGFIVGILQPSNFGGSRILSGIAQPGFGQHHHWIYPYTLKHSR